MGRQVGTQRAAIEPGSCCQGLTTLNGTYLAMASYDEMCVSRWECVVAGPGGGLARGSRGVDRAVRVVEMAIVGNQ